MHEQIDLEMLQRQRSLLKGGVPEAPGEIQPFEGYGVYGDQQDRLLGEKLIAAGEVGCIIVAGGQATRLKVNGPKGMVPISVIKHKSLFQLFCEKTKAAGKLAQRLLPIAIMTSPQNHAATVQFFKDSTYFGLEPSQVEFFVQQTLPFLDEQGHLFLETEDKTAAGPDGNGSTLENFYNAGIWEAWTKQGVRHLNFVLIDNPLADPFDPYLIGYHARMGSDITVKCTPRRNTLEKVGLLVKQAGRACVIEYTEISDAERTATDADGKLTFLLANISLFCFSMASIPEWTKEKLPLHLAHKTVKGIDGQKMAWKFEKFIFDLLPLAERVQALLYPRAICFAPLKNQTGADDLASVQHALQARDRQILTEITGEPSPETPFELAQEFYYPTPELKARWIGKTISGQTYLIDP